MAIIHFIIITLDQKTVICHLNSCIWLIRVSLFPPIHIVQLYWFGFLHLLWHSVDFACSRQLFSVEKPSVFRQKHTFSLRYSHRFEPLCSLTPIRKCTKPPEQWTHQPSFKECACVMHSAQTLTEVKTHKKLLLSAFFFLIVPLPFHLLSHESHRKNVNLFKNIFISFSG